MDENEIRDRLRAAAATAAEPSTPVDDLVRGRRARRRRTATVGAGAVATVTVLGATTAWAAVTFDGGAGPSPTPLVAAHGGTPRQPTPHTADATLHHRGVYPRHQQEKITRQHRSIAVGPRFGAGYANPQWLQDVYHLTQQVLDPDHQYTSYDENEQASSGPGGNHSLGTRVSWSQAGDPGLGFIGVDVTTPGSDEGKLDCESFGGCTQQHDAQYGDYLLGGEPGGSDGFMVVLTQGDGEVAVVSANPLFGNNSLIATTAPLPSLEQVLALASSPDLNLPTGS
jgi:hypothetical protein